MTIGENPCEPFSRFPLGIVLVDEAGTVTRIRREASQALGRPSAALVGSCVDELVGRRQGLVEAPGAPEGGRT